MKIFNPEYFSKNYSYEIELSFNWVKAMFKAILDRLTSLSGGLTFWILWNFSFIDSLINKRHNCISIIWVDSCLDHKFEIFWYQSMFIHSSILYQVFSCIHTATAHDSLRSEFRILHGLWGIFMVLDSVVFNLSHPKSSYLRVVIVKV